MIKNKHFYNKAFVFLKLIHIHRQHVYEVKFRITADNNDRIVPTGEQRITADSSY